MQSSSSCFEATCVDPSKEKFLTKDFVFDPKGFMNLSTLEDGHNSRMNHFKESGNDENPITIRNLNLIRIQDNDDNPSPTINLNPTRIKDLLTYDRGPIIRACAKKMKEALYMLIRAIWAQSTNLN